MEEQHKIKNDQIKTLKVDRLRKICSAEGLKTAGKKGELIERIILARSGRSDRYISTLTKCKYCGEGVRVTGTDRKIIKDGRVLLTRYIKCNGARRHTYPLKTIIEPQKTQ